MTVNGKPRRMSGGQAVVECIRQEGVKHVFCVPGESYLPVLDAFHEAPEIRLITNRQEGGACYMAEAYGKATRNVGVCIVTRGPGATNASIGVHCAHQDSTPLVLLVGQVARPLRGREALQEMDYSHFFGHMTKMVAEVVDPERIPQVLTRAFHVARSGRPGPVVVAFPRDVLEEHAEMVIPKPINRTISRPDSGMIKDMVARINAAQKPVLLVGSGVQYAGARKELVAFVEKFNVAAITTFRHMDAFPNTHPNYVGNLSSARSAAREVVGESDLIVVLGDRLTQHTTNHYQLIRPDHALIHVDADAGVIGRNFPPDLAIVADAKVVLSEALEMAPPQPDSKRDGWIGEYHKVFQAWSTPPKRPSKLTSMESVMADLRANLPADTVITVDAGLNAGWIHRYLDYNAENSFLAPNVGSMGYGYPSGLAAKLAHPERNVVSLSGDGGFMMTMQEMATGVQFGVKTTHILFNNGSWGTIRMNQEANFTGRAIGTDLVNPDFCVVAGGFGFETFRVEKDAEFKPALEKALKSSKPAFIEVMTDLEMLTPDATLTEVKAGKPGR